MNLYPYLKLVALVLVVILLAMFLLGELDASLTIGDS